MNGPAGGKAPAAHHPSAAYPDTCPRCGAAFACGIGTGSCWCAQLPPLAALPEDLPAACLCPACLRELSARRDEPQ
jgi:hypothetical protein